MLNCSRSACNDQGLGRISKARFSILDHQWLIVAPDPLDELNWISQNKCGFQADSAILHIASQVPETEP